MSDPVPEGGEGIPAWHSGIVSLESRVEALEQLTNDLVDDVVQAATWINELRKPASAAPEPQEETDDG